MEGKYLNRKEVSQGLGSEIFLYNLCVLRKIELAEYIHQLQPTPSEETESPDSVIPI
jgi:hypothetical protein